MESSNNHLQTQNPIYIPQPPKPDDWKINQMYKNAFHVAKNFRTLWLVGLAFGIFGGGCSLNYSGGGGGGGLENVFPSATPMPDLTTKTSHVLGASTKAFSEYFANFFSNFPFYLLFLIGFEILLFFIFWIVVIYLGKAWSNAAIIISTENALIGKKLKLPEISQLTLPKVKPMLKLMIILFAVLIPPVILLAILGILIATKILPVVLIPFLILLIIASLIFYIGISIFAQRAVSLDNHYPIEAIKFSLKMAKKKILWIFIVGIINNIISAIVLFVPIIAVILVALILGLLLGWALGKILVGIVILALVALIFSLLFLFPLVNAIVSVGKTAMWNQAYQKTKEAMK